MRSQIAFQFDALGNNTQLRDPLGRVLNRTFDGSGNLTATLDQNGNRVAYTYDGNNNLTSTTYAGRHDRTKHLRLRRQDANAKG